MDDQLTESEYPRARGKHELDITAFLPSQKDWDLERDNGWKAIGLEALYKFELDYKTPTYKVPWMYHEGCVVLDLESNPVKDFANIPLTCSSKIEGVEMEAMRRGDPRIAMKDFVARLSVYPFQASNQQRLTCYRPEQRKGEKPITANALNMRITRFRSENRVTALNERWGTNNGKHSLLDRMTQTARDANSTRELKKLSEDEEKKAQEPDARKHAANARGRPRGQKGQNHEENDISGPANAYEEGATKPACRESGTNKTPHVASSLDRPKKRQKICDMIPSAAQETYPGTLYGDESLDRLQRSNLANHYDGPSRYSSNFHDILSTVITTAASSEKAQPFPIRDGQISSEGFETFTEPSRFLAREFPNYQQMIPTVQQHSKNWIADVASPLENPYHDSQGQMLPSGDVAEDFFGTKQRISNTFANGTDPAEIPLPMQAEYQNNAPRIDQDFGMQWNWSENPFSVPDLMTSQEPWRNDFMNGARSTSGDDAFLDALFGEHEGANTQELLSYDPTMAAGHENE